MANNIYPPIYHGAGGVPVNYSQPIYPANVTGTPATYSQPNYPHPGLSVQQHPPPNYDNSTVTTTVTVQPTYVASAGIGPGPSQMVCPSCHATILTSVNYEPSGKTHLIALLLCLFVLWPCVCLPYCIDSCQSAKHYCPNCRSYLGSYSK